MGTHVDLDVVFRALASQQRRRIIVLLSGHERDPGAFRCAPGAPGEVCACEIAERLGLSAPTISHHMGILREAGLVTARKQGLWVYYALDRSALAEAAHGLETL